MGKAATLVAHEYDAGFEAGARGDEPTEPADCTCKDSWLAGYHYGRAVQALPERETYSLNGGAAPPSRSRFKIRCYRVSLSRR